MLNRALRIENDAVSNGESSRDNTNAPNGTMELLALCARAAAACGDLDEAKTMAEKARSLAAGSSSSSSSSNSSSSSSSSSSSIMFWVHVICGEAFLLMAAHAYDQSPSSPACRSHAVAAAAAFQCACDVVPRLQHLSAITQLQLHVSMGKSTSTASSITTITIAPGFSLEQSQSYDRALQWYDKHFPQCVFVTF